MKMYFKLSVLLLMFFTFIFISSAVNAESISAPSGNEIIDWNEKLNLDSRVPVNKFKAVYFDRNNPISNQFIELVDNVSINASWDYHNIKSSNLGAYFIGKLVFEEDTTKEIYIRQSHAKTLLIINGEVVFRGDRDGKIEHVFTAGDNIVEVQYLNFWHTTSFSLAMGDMANIVSKGDSYKMSDDYAGKNARLANVHESRDRNFNINAESISSPEDDRGIDWTEKSNLEGKIPVNKFKAVYFDRNNPISNQFIELVDNVSINTGRDYHSISSSNLEAHFIGNLVFEEDTTKEIYINQSHAKTLLIINGEVVFSGGRDGKIEHVFTAGDNIVEVQYTNGWHTASFSLAMRDTIKTISKDDFYKLLGNYTDKNAGLAYAYESKDKDFNINVRVNLGIEEGILVLSSYELTNWYIENLEEVKPALIAIFSHADGSVLSNENVPEGTEVVYINAFQKFYDTGRCNCHARHFHCENRNGMHVLDFASRIKQEARVNLISYHFEYATESMDIGETNLSAEKISELQIGRESEISARQACINTGSEWIK